MKKADGKKKAFDIEPEAIEKIDPLQKRGHEFGGFIKGKDLAEVRIGQRTSVAVDINVKKYQYDWHVHPSFQPPMQKPDESNKKEMEQFKCAIEKYTTLSSTLSPEDCFIALQYRSMQGIQSLMFPGGTVTRYYLADPVKYENFKEKVVRADYGDVNEDLIMTALNNAFVRIWNTNADEIYDKKQGFTYCEDKFIEINLKKQWYDFLGSIGMVIEEEEIK